jgi:hypothetical protein
MDECLLRTLIFNNPGYGGPKTSWKLENTFDEAIDFLPSPYVVYETVNIVGEEEVL